MSQRPACTRARAVLLCLCSVYLLSLTFASGALAASHTLPPHLYPAFPLSQHAGASNGGPITITSETYRLKFPNSIDYTLSARDSQSALDTATISIQFKDTPTSSDTEAHVVKISTPAKQITLHWHEDTSGEHFHYPGTPVTYSWTLQDQTNNQYSDQGVDFTTLDTRYSWQHLSQGLLNVYWYNRPATFGQALLARASSAIAQISKNLGSGPLHAIEVWVYQSDSEFHGALAPGAYEWIGGEAHPDLNEAFISAIDDQDTTLTRDLPHELTHLVLHQLVALGVGYDFPRWFDEGMAVYNQFYHEPEMAYLFLRAAQKHRLLRIDDLDSSLLSPNGNTALMAYAESWNIVAYLYKTFGLGVMTALILKMHDPQTNFAGDLTQALGEDQLHMENAWRLQLNQLPVLTPAQLAPIHPVDAHITLPVAAPSDNTAPLLTTLGAALVVLPIAGVAAFLLYRRRRQGSLAAQSAAQAMAQLPPPVSPGARLGPYSSARYIPGPFDRSDNPYGGPLATGEMPSVTPWRYEHPCEPADGWRPAPAQSQDNPQK
jgi:Peptidase MA superfamily